MRSTGSRRKPKTRGSADFSFSSDTARFANKNAYVQGHVTFAIIAVEFDVGGGYLGAGDRWKVTVLRDDTGVSEIISLPANPKRNPQLQRAAEHVSAHGPIPNVRLVRHGSAFYFHAAEAQS